MRTLLQLTDTAPQTDDDEVFGPEVILACTRPLPLRAQTDMTDKSRTLNLEQSFFDTLALYFRLEPVVGGRTEAKIYICRRWRVTEDWVVPEEKDVMNGSKEVIRGRGGMSVMEEMLGAIEWD
jgi:hypothetical protein